MICSTGGLARRRGLSVAAGVALMLLGAEAMAAQGFTEALTGGKPSLDARYRYETVNQNSALKDAAASTLRLRLGYETGQFNGFGLAVEAEHLSALGGESYNSTTNGKTAYSVVADPEFTEINQAYLSYGGLSGTKLKYGRQRLILDNHRFIGNVGWRQNEQTFDSFSVTNESLRDTKITAGYIYNVNRVFSDNSAVGNFKMRSPIVNVNYRGWRFGEIVGYGYLLKFVNTPASSTQTFGLRLKGSAPLSAGGSLLYTAEYASQRDYSNNPQDFRLNYYILEGGATLGAGEFKLGYELLGGNGTQSFQTPLATLHAMNGWADQFLTTPAKGLKDVYVSAGANLLDARFEAIYHDFRADKGGSRYGGEWNLVATKAIDKNYTVGAKYASYNAKGFSVDTDKFWLWAETKF